MILENFNYFVQVVNPMYTFPVIGVIFCVLLVFAFGFKTPAQPPSFDFVEHRKVSNKKKSKSKEMKLPKPVQNGSSNVSEPISTSSVLLTKSQNSKAFKSNDTSTTKKNAPVENKNKYKKGDSLNFNLPSDAKEQVTDITGSGEWTQQLSRKDRKNRKGKDVAVNLKNTLNLLTVSSKENKSVEMIMEIREPAQGRMKDKENILTNEISTNEQDILAKKETLKDDSFERTMEKKKAALEKSLSPLENKDTAMTNKSKKEYKKIKKAATEDLKTDILVQNVASEEMTMLEAEMQLDLFQTKLPKQESQDEGSTAREHKSEQSSIALPETEGGAKHTSNVVFDELGDKSQDAKPQKKKKKVRRE